MAQQTIIARQSDNIFRDAVITCDKTPMATYDLAVLGLNTSITPATRVRFTDPDPVITFTLPEARQGDILAITVSNADVGLSPPALTITNGNGLSQDVPIPTMPGNRIPRTAILDLSILTPTDATRLDDVWALHFSNSVDVELGGGVYLYTKRELTPEDLQWSFRYSKQHARSDTPNEYLMRYILDYETQVRGFDAVIRCPLSQRDEIEEWFDSVCVGPGLLWPFPDVNDAYVGTWGDRFDAQQIGEFTDYYDVTIPFTELSKGKPV